MVLGPNAPAKAGASMNKARLLGRGPGLRRGDCLRCSNPDVPTSHNAALRLHHGLTPLRGDLHRIDRQPARTGGTAPIWLTRQSHRPIQYQAVGLVRRTPRQNFSLYARAADEGMAAQLEGSVDRRGQSRMAGCNGGYSILAFGLAHLTIAPAKCTIALAQAGAWVGRPRLFDRGPGLRRGDWERARTDLLLHAVLKLAGVEM